ncbi:hypothetical protein BJ170DRAFT_7196 [Xylariales sp. AK1849]|nr:hypothetical protein BJ170DRAFT_7196 [Xylariales sp. AK1849]
MAYPPGAEAAHLQDRFSIGYVVGTTQHRPDWYSSALDLLTSPQSGPRRKYSKGNAQYHVDGTAAGTQVSGTPDTGAGHNVISPSMAASLKLTPTEGTETEVVLPSGKRVTSRGTVEFPWKFNGEKEIHNLVCHVILNCLYNLILGSKFLRDTQTLKKYTHRIKRTLSPRKRLFSLNLVDFQTQRLLGSLEGEAVSALPDTGSDVMLLSGDYVRERGFKLDTSPENIIELVSVDGSTAWTTGLVRDVIWEFHDSRGAVFCDFYVVEDLVVDMILSQDFVFEFEVFSTCEEWLIDITTLEAYVCTIRLKKKMAQKNRTGTQGEGALSPEEEELLLREQARDEIRMLPPSLREARQKEELDRQLRWRAIGNVPDEDTPDDVSRLKEEDGQPLTLAKPLLSWKKVRWRPKPVK